MKDQDVTIKLSLAQVMLDYLSTRPYGEVYQVVQAIQSQVGPQITPVATPVETSEAKA